ncbi:MAG: hypothetical protein V4736_13845, partial [Bdellovibrionota bacterium]
MDLAQLLAVPEEDRDLPWEEKFFTTFVNSNVKLLSSEPQTGPDGWPYLLVSTEEGDESVQKLLEWLSTRGIGLVVNPSKPYPDYVFTFGMIWYFRKNGKFFSTAANQAAGSIEMGVRDLQFGEPNPDYLPQTARKILKDFFLDQGVIAPKIMMVSQDGKNYDVGFSLESLGNPPATEHDGVAEAISWFLPPHYSILLLSENGLP